MEFIHSLRRDYGCKDDIVIYTGYNEDEEIFTKKDFEVFCKSVGMNSSTALTIFMKKVVAEKRIPFEVSADPFYDEKNVSRIMKAIENLNAGKGVEHDIIEVE